MRINHRRSIRNIKRAARLLSLITLITAALTVVSCNILNFLPLEIIDWSPGDKLIDSVDNIVISVTFSEKVDRIRAENSFSLLENGKKMEGKYVWTDLKKLRFIPLHKLIVDAPYEIQVSTDCEDTDGNSLRKQFSHRFSTSDDKTRPVILTVSPADRSTVTGRSTPVIITFSEPVNASSFYGSFSLSPDITGDFAWSDNNSTVTFTPLRYYQYHTDYTVSVTKDLSDLSYNTLKEDYSFKFTVGTDTDKPYVINTGESSGSLNLIPDNPEDGIITVNSGWEANWNFTVTFNEEIETGTLSSAVVFSPPVNFTLENSGKQYLSSVKLSPDTRLEYGETYSLTLNDSIRDCEGNSLEPSIFYFTVDGTETKPPEITHTVFLEDPAAPGVLAELNYDDTLSLGNYPDSPGSTEGFFDIYIHVADLSAVNMDELKLMVMDHFDINITNAAAEFTIKDVVIDPESKAETPVPNPPPSADEIVARIFMDITNNSGTAGIAELTLSKGFEDGNENAIAEEWLTRLQKN